MTLARAQDALVGRSFGEFVLRERIGEGGFGAVYRAVQPALDREAVVKVLHQRLHASQAAADRFLREAKLASKLDHPYAAHIYAFGAEPDGELWIAMELVRGTPLDQVLKLHGPLTLERFVPLLDRICEVVHTAHEQGIVHRDLKPANVMVLSRAGRLLPKLLDFGIAKGLASTTGGVATEETLDGEPDASAGFAETLNTPAGLTVRGAIMGSPPYMAPEQWLDAGQVDGRTDLYALGILAFECLTGRPPFLGATITTIAQAHANDLPPSLGPRFPSALDKVIAKVLAKVPEGRYPDALALAAAVRQASGITGDAAPPLPALEAPLRDAAVTGLPQPIAEAIAAYEASRNSHQGRDALALAGRTIARYLGLLALACRSRVSGDEASSEAIRALYRRSLSDREWVDLARELTRSWVGRRDAYPIPELVGAFHDDDVGAHLEALVSLRDAEGGADDAVLASVEAALAHATLLLEGLAFLRDYPLVVTTAGGYAERWMGLRRAQRSTIAVRGKGLAIGSAALLDRDGAPVLSLEPLFRVAAPTPGAPLDLFMFEGRDRRGAKLVALPSSFEQHDDGLWDWFRAQLTGSLDETESTVAEERPPYRGLSAFSAADHEMFVGREKLVDAFANRLKIQPLLAVVGRSGAGKSSFVHAGVVPALPPAWRAITLRPGPAPLGSLIARLEHAGIAAVPEWRTGDGRPSGSLAVVSSLRDVLATDREALGHLLRADAAQRGPILLVIDQLEELFTLCQDPDERRTFAEAIAAAARSAEDPVRVVLTLRDDFLVRAEQVPALRNRLGQGLQILTVPAGEDLLRIVTEPARRVGYELEGDLAADMVKEVADQPGALALISFTANKLWELRDRHFKQLTRSAYRTLGGVGGALARHAELTLEGMMAEERALTREAFRHLVTTQNTRTVLPRKELRQLLGNDAHADAVIETLVSARLLVASENESGVETIEIIHEALLVTWPRLVEWRREDSEGTRFREQLRSAAKQWDERGRVKGLLWRGDALGDFTRWRARQTGPLTDVEAAFADASLADVARARRNVRVLLACAFAALGAVVVGLVLLNARVAGQRERAEDAATQLHDSLQHRYEDQGRQLVLAGDPLHALAYLGKARELGASGRAHDFLVAQAIRATDGALVEVRDDTALIFAHFSHDGTRLVTGRVGVPARIWDAQTGAPLVTMAQAGTASTVSFAPDDSSLLEIVDRSVVLWDPRRGTELARFDHDAKATCGVYAPDGALVAGGTTTGSVAAWAIADHARRFATAATGVAITACAFSPDGTMLATGDARGTTRIWDVATGRMHHELAAQREQVHEISFSPDSARIVTASWDGTAVEWSAETGAKLFAFAHRGRVYSAEFSPDGSSIVTASADHTGAIWDARTGEPRQKLEGHTAGLVHARFSPDGAYVVTASEDASAWLWDAATGRVAARWRGDEDRVEDASFDRTGERVVTASDDGRAIVWKVAPQDHIAWLRGHTGAIFDARFSPDGERVATASGDGTARIWSATTGAEVGSVHAPGDGLSSAVFSPDGRQLATFGGDGIVRIWELDTYRSSRELTASAPGVDAVIDWSGSSLVAASADGSIRCWDTRNGALRFETRGHGGRVVYSAAFDPTGTKIITTGDDQVTRVWDLAGKQLAAQPDSELPVSASYDSTGERVLGAVSRERAKIWRASDGKSLVELEGHLGRIVDATWSNDGAFAITSSTDNTARIWDTTTGAMLATLAHSQVVVASSFSPDGTHVVIVGDGSVAAIQELPLVPPRGEVLDELLACRVPFAVRDDLIVGRAKSACQHDRRVR